MCELLYAQAHLTILAPKVEQVGRAAAARRLLRDLMLLFLLPIKEVEFLPAQTHEPAAASAPRNTSPPIITTRHRCFRRASGQTGSTRHCKARLMQRLLQHLLSGARPCPPPTFLCRAAHACQSALRCCVLVTERWRGGAATGLRAGAQALVQLPHLGSAPHVPRGPPHVPAPPRCQSGVSYNMPSHQPGWLE